MAAQTEPISLITPHAAQELMCMASDALITWLTENKAPKPVLDLARGVDFLGLYLVEQASGSVSVEVQQDSTAFVLSTLNALLYLGK